MDPHHLHHATMTPRRQVYVNSLQFIVIAHIGFILYISCLLPTRARLQLKPDYPCANKIASRTIEVPGMDTPLFWILSQEGPRLIVENVRCVGGGNAVDRIWD